MSDFIKSVVQEVMKPYQKPKENPIYGGESSFQTTAIQTAAPKNKQEIPGVNRPNYQRSRMNKRLSVTQNVHLDKTSNQSKKDISQSVNSSPASNGYATGSLAKLQTMSLVQGNRPVSSDNEQLSSVTKRSNKESQLIGQTSEGISAWLFSGLHPDLKTSFQRSLKSNSIGVITSKKCTVGQLFLLNEVLREFSTIKYCLIWDKDSKQNFVLELFEDDQDRLLRAVKTLFQQLAKKSYKSTQIYKTLSPSPWLTKQLELNNAVNGVAVLEGIDQYTSILLLDRQLKKSPEMVFDYLIEKNYLLLYGQYDIVTQVSEKLQKEAERIR